MKLFDATLDLAAFAKGTEDYTVTSVSGDQLVCRELSGRVAEFGGGTIWFRSGKAAGKFGRIRQSSGQTIWTENIYDVEPGDEITIGSWQEFDTQNLINAVNSVLRMYRIMKYDESLVYDPDVVDYELPAGVTEDVREVMLHWSTGQQWSVCHYWRIEDRWLVLYNKHRNIYEKGGTIRLSYVDYHGAVGKDDEISSQVDPLYLRYMSWLYLCRHLIQQTHKDNLVSTDMYNEAKIYERDYGQLPNKRLKIRTMTFPCW